MQRIRKARTLTWTGPVCVEGRRAMSLEEKQKHFAECSHPQCVALLAHYRQIGWYVRMMLTDPLSEKGRKGTDDSQQSSKATPAA